MLLDRGTITEATGSGAKDLTYEKEPTIIKDDAQPTVPVGGGGGEPAPCFKC